MSPDDPRHGTYAGYMAHRKDGTTVCNPCRTARRRYYKAGRVRRERGIANRIPLGERAWKILDESGCTTASQLSGIQRNNLYRIHRAGPGAQVLRSTRDAILRIRAAHTPIGLQRRLRALARIGWTMEEVAAWGGAGASNLRVLLRRATPPSFVRAPFAEQILDAYEQLHMRTPGASRSVTKQINRAIANKWAAPLAWDIDKIDDPDEQPRGHVQERARKTDLDPVVVDRILAGDASLAATRAERLEVIRRWPGSQTALERLRPDWNVARDLRDMRADGLGGAA